MLVKSVMSAVVNRLGKPLQYPRQLQKLELKAKAEE